MDSEDFKVMGYVVGIIGSLILIGSIGLGGFIGVTLVCFGMILLHKNTDH